MKDYSNAACVSIYRKDLLDLKDFLSSCRLNRSYLPHENSGKSENGPKEIIRSCQLSVKQQLRRSLCR